MLPIEGRLDGLKCVGVGGMAKVTNDLSGAMINLQYGLYGVEREKEAVMRRPPDQGVGCAVSFRNLPLGNIAPAVKDGDLFSGGG